MKTLLNLRTGIIPRFPRAFICIILEQLVPFIQGKYCKYQNVYALVLFEINTCKMCNLAQSLSSVRMNECKTSGVRLVHN